MNPRKSLSWRCRILLLLCALSVLFFAAEAGVRVLGIDGPRRNTGIEPHPLWHHWHRPNYSFDYQVAAEGYSVPIRFNSFGMRDNREVVLQKKPGTFRIAVLGDSFVEALQVREEDGVCKRLESHLRETMNQPVEVLNFGCSGFSTLLELIQLQHWVLQFEPDVVVLFHHFSDITEDWRFLKRMTAQGCVPGIGGRQSQFGAMAEMSQLYRAFRQVFRKSPPAASADASLKECYDAIIHDPYTNEDAEAWHFNFVYLNGIAKTLHQKNIRFLAVAIPLGPQVEPVDAAFTQATKLRFLNSGQRLEYRGYQEALKMMCQIETVPIPLLDLLDDFRTENSTGTPRFYLPRDQHWTAAGHDLAAKCVASRLSSAVQK